MTLEPRPKTLDVLPSEQEREEYGLTLKNGVELQLGRQDPLLITAKRVAEKYPHHLCLIQSGNFLHAYNKSAYFLHKLKSYKLTVVGTEMKTGIRCGLPILGHKRRLWRVCHDFGVPYLVVLGGKGNYQLHISNATAENTLMDEIPEDIVAKLVDDLCELLGAKAAEIQETAGQPPSFLTNNPQHELFSQHASYKS